MQATLFPQAEVLAPLTPREIAGLPGFAEAVALYLTPPKRECLTNWSLLNAYLRSKALGASRETFRVLFLDKKNCLIADEAMGHGTVDHAPVYPREVARRALELGAASVILTHNHPSGDPSPSGADIDMTRRIVEALRVLRIEVLDHVVTGAEAVVSFKSTGLL